MHGNDELGQNKGSALLGVRKHPDAAEDLVRQARLLKDLFGMLSGEHTAILEVLTLEEASIL
jgi:hypothetical protein